MNLIVAKNIRRLRDENKLSMDELSRLSGVSKSMLAQIERGDGNPCLLYTSIPTLTEQGFQLVTVSELIRFRGGVKNGGVYYSFRPR